MADTDSQQCEPVFVTARALLSLHVPDTTDMCRAAKNSSCRGSIRGAQCIWGLWRIYPLRQEARNKLLLECMNLWGTHLSLLPQNRFTLQDQNSEKPATKLWEGNVPLCVDDNVIETALKNLGCEMRSTVRKELARDKNGKLTNWKMGRRFVFITVPTTPLPKICTIGIFSAELYHSEMKEKRDESRKKCAVCWPTMRQQHAQTRWSAWPVLGQDTGVPSATSHYQEPEVTQLTSTRREGKPQKLSPLTLLNLPHHPALTQIPSPPSQEVFDNATCSAPR